MQNLALEEAFEPVVRQNEKIKKRNSNVRGAKKINLLRWLITVKSELDMPVLAVLLQLYQ